MIITETLGDFVPQVRALLRDTSGRHFDDDTILDGVVLAFVHLCSVRPEARYQGTPVVQDTVFPRTGLAEFPMTYDGKWRRGIIYFAAACVCETGITDAVYRELADALKQKAEVVFTD